MPGKKLYIQDTSGSAYECEIDPATTIGTIAAEFFEAKDWPQQDSYGGGQRAVVEFADPKTGKNIRLGVDQSIEQANLPDGAMLYIYPEAVAGAIDTRRRLAAVKADQEDMSGLPDAYPHISYETNRDDTPDEYNITFNCRSFAAPPIHEGERPELSDLHKVKILLTGEYPREAPLLEWLTKLFHPNVNTDGLVCLGQLRERYLPGLGLKRIVLLLDEMLHWRNYDFWESYNQEAAEWAMKPANWPYIEEIGGIRFTVPYKELINPENWGDTEKKGAFFKGTAQPPYLLAQWKEYQLRRKIQFKRINQSAIS